jgi:hypothetical protein
MSSMNVPKFTNDQGFDRHLQASDALLPWVNSLDASLTVLRTREYFNEGQYPEIPTEKLLTCVEQAKLALAGKHIKDSIDTVDKSEEMFARTRALGTDFRELAFALIRETEVTIPEMQARATKAATLLSKLAFGDL